MMLEIFEDKKHSPTRVLQTQRLNYLCPVSFLTRTWRRKGHSHLVQII